MSQIFSPMIVLGVIVFGTANLIRSLPVEGGLPELIGTVAGSYVGIAILLAALKLGYLQIGSSDEESGTGLKGQPVERTESGELRPPETEGWTRKSTILIGALVVFTVVLLSFLYL